MIYGLVLVTCSNSQPESAPWKPLRSFKIRYALTVRSHFPIQIIVLMVLLASCLVPGDQWYCEGRLCGITVGYCCCTSPSCQDEKCLTHGDERVHTGLYPTGCECHM